VRVGVAASATGTTFEATLSGPLDVVDGATVTVGVRDGPTESDGDGSERAVCVPLVAAAAGSRTAVEALASNCRTLTREVDATLCSSAASSNGVSGALATLSTGGDLTVAVSLSTDDGADCHARRNATACRWRETSGTETGSVRLTDSWLCCGRR